ncbi:hypothetical protein [Fimbriiglobus ruber]|uniref:Uncharacterized protein n=1 Tax=Fimbriiglobus ruber TaxID=1908690 RepID=A0A225EBC4_9BACT|nr:hypothetical protein [Fimbriiglobus ruber]OWK45687.1 hypothetical protein FRUB_02018 [Fimbriiglobus ruber]
MAHNLNEIPTVALCAVLGGSPLTAVGPWLPRRPWVSTTEYGSGGGGD